MTKTWTKPQFRELNLSAEIGMYYEDEGEPFEGAGAEKSEPPTRGPERESPKASPRA
jgi:coenzyme PQQ precursor peptide PqqA